MWRSGYEPGPAPDRFLVGLATLTLVAEVAEEEPLLCLVDDAQWLDEASAQALAFVARRVSAERVALLFGVRDPDADAGAVVPFAGLPELRLSGLGDAQTRWRYWPPRSVNRSMTGSATRSSPRPRGTPWHCWSCLRTTPSRRDWPAGSSYRTCSPGSAPGRGRLPTPLGGLPVETQLLLLVAAANPTGEAALLWRAATHLGIAPEAAAPAERAGLLEIDSPGPLPSPAGALGGLPGGHIARQASRARRAGRSHGSPPRPGPPRLAPSTSCAPGTDEDAAAGLSARPTGLAPGAGWPPQPRSCNARPTSPRNPATRASRALGAAYVMHDAGSTDAALDLLTVAAAGPLDALQEARGELLRRPDRVPPDPRQPQAPGLLLDAARHARPAARAVGPRGLRRGDRGVVPHRRPLPPPSTTCAR